MTEDEAKTKWCPMVHTRYIGTIAQKGQEERAMELSERKERSSKCIASDCMMWQWVTTPADALKQSGLGQKYQQSENGYCGLAGKPE